MPTKKRAPWLFSQMAGEGKVLLASSFLKKNGATEQTNDRTEGLRIKKVDRKRERERDHKVEGAVDVVVLPYFLLYF